jgi:hypothetical protein
MRRALVMMAVIIPPSPSPITKLLQGTSRGMLNECSQVVCRDRVVQKGKPLRLRQAPAYFKSKRNRIVTTTILSYGDRVPGSRTFEGRNRRIAPG